MAAEATAASPLRPEWCDHAERAGVYLPRLSKGRNTDTPEQLERVSRSAVYALRWLADGYNVGIGMGPKCCLMDADSPAAVEAPGALAGEAPSPSTPRAGAAASFSVGLRLAVVPCLLSVFITAVLRTRMLAVLPRRPLQSIWKRPSKYAAISRSPSSRVTPASICT